MTTGAGTRSPRSRAVARNGADGRTARERLLASADELFYAEGVQTVGIQNNWKLRLSYDQADELLCFVLHGKPWADGENGFAPQDLRKFAVIEIAKARGPGFR